MQYTSIHTSNYIQIYICMHIHLYIYWPPNATERLQRRCGLYSYIHMRLGLTRYIYKYIFADALHTPAPLPPAMQPSDSNDGAVYISVCVCLHILRTRHLYIHTYAYTYMYAYIEREISPPAQPNDSNDGAVYVFGLYKICIYLYTYV